MAVYEMKSPGLAGEVVRFAGFLKARGFRIFQSSVQDAVVEWAHGLQLCQLVAAGNPAGGVQSPVLDLAMLILLLVLCFIPALKLHHRSRRLGY